MALNATHGKKYRVGNIRDLPGYDTTTGVSVDWGTAVLLMSLCTPAETPV